MTAALYFLIAQGVLGALDTLIYHELGARLPSTPTARLELRLHASRDFAYAIIFGTLAWYTWNGALVWALLGILLFEIIITLWDFIEEDLTRKLPAGERVMHTIMAILYGAFLANLGPALITWAQSPTGFGHADYGIVSWIMTAFSVGVLMSGVRDAVASGRVIKYEL